MANSTVLIVDDERSARDGLVRLFKSDYNVLVAEDGKTALELLKNHVIDIMLSDVRMPGMDGLTLMEKARQNHPHLICIILTAYGDVELAVQAMQRGATDFMTKPIHLDKLEVVVKRCLRSRDLERENADLKAHLDVRFGMENMIGQSAPMQSIFETIRQVAQSRATVLIQGESGTGKELVAKAIHQLSARKSSVFVPVHCAALAENLLESELFGHEKGAFTGAMERRIGRFEKAGGGSLFLDEISEINASVQVKILRALEERQTAGSAHAGLRRQICVLPSRGWHGHVLCDAADATRRAMDLFVACAAYSSAANKLYMLPKKTSRMLNIPIIFHNKSIFLFFLFYKFQDFLNHIGYSY